MTKTLLMLTTLLLSSPALAADLTPRQMIEQRMVHFTIGQNSCVALFADGNRFTKESVSVSCTNLERCPGLTLTSAERLERANEGSCSADTDVLRIYWPPVEEDD